MSVAPNGRIDVVWLDTRDNSGTYLSSLYYSFSIDNGVTWSQNERLSEAFDPHLGWPQQNKMGDYFDMISYDEYAVLAWAGTFNGEQDVYFGRIYQSVVAVDDERDEKQILEAYSLLQNYPNPFNPSTKIKFTVPSNVILKAEKNLNYVTLKVYDVLGNEIAVLVDEEKPAGTYEVEFGTAELTSGVYFYRIQSSNYVETKKMLLIK
ncbi:MAG: T9SS type A sorting domain-containing protein [Ignavibacteria bacterium]|nr:T9SS type A sorting domain-containing protein [Ignavibacteria bacterium]MBT8382647.1 T9SS type A sorting domain-containing protein [Ignavibacteria bacterium]MBT8391184.1 T9SS type A sorting domain-containing protein [Ignavibacteria bacterium]NNJ52788.1 T9SS type A sorting domain-containing protein [Ignavibacteriaceae bacterium]NNL22153.1 T9SS type A sorting domain-containing protein [Ignavibacteriaceae bacterium]